MGAQHFHETPPHTSATAKAGAEPLAFCSASETVRDRGRLSVNYHIFGCGGFRLPTAVPRVFAAGCPMSCKQSSHRQRDKNTDTPINTEKLGAPLPTLNCKTLTANPGILAAEPWDAPPYPNSP